jgi:hypothetical protein
METTMHRVMESRWWMPAFSVFLGLLILAAGAAGDDVGFGLFGLGVMTAIGALFLLGGRSEPLQGLGGPGRDERWEAIDMRATAFSGPGVDQHHHRRVAVGDRPRSRRQPVRPAGCHRRGGVPRGLGDRPLAELSRIGAGWMTTRSRQRG